MTRAKICDLCTLAPNNLTDKTCEVLSASLPGSSSVSVTPQAVPARYPPAFRLSLVRSCHGGTSPESHSCLQPTMKLSRITVLGQCPSPIEFGRGHFAREVFELFVNFATERPLADFSPTTNRNPQGQFHIQFFWNFRIFTFFQKEKRQGPTK